MSVENYLNERTFTFLSESNKIESIDSIDYHAPKYQIVGQGHFGAFVEAQEMAKSGEPLSLRKVRDWQKLIAVEQRDAGLDLEDSEVGHIRNVQTLNKNVRIARHAPPRPDFVPTLLETLIEKINDALKSKAVFDDDAEYCKFLADSFLEFEKIHPFMDGNGRTGRLIASYISTACERPFIIFNSEMIERNRYYKAHETFNKMRIFIAEKIKETILGTSGHLMECVKSPDDQSYNYFGQEEEKLVIQWHTLNQAVEQWRLIAQMST